MECSSRTPCDTTFLGLEVESNVFEFIYDESRKEVTHQRALKFAKEHGEQRYRINIPFQAYLENYAPIPKGKRKVYHLE